MVFTEQFEWGGRLATTSDEVFQVMESKLDKLKCPVGFKMEQQKILGVDRDGNEIELAALVFVTAAKRVRM